MTLNDIKAIPTFYNGTQYRSRLEARWAAFFDLVGWRYDYEPQDLNGWIPDFALRGQGIDEFTPRITLVEVKPVSERPLDICGEIERSGVTHEVVLCGLGPIHTEHGIYLGWLMDDHRMWALAPFGKWINAKTIGFCHNDNEFRDRISSKHDGGCYGCGDFNANEVVRAWREAGNIVQWKPPR